MDQVIEVIGLGYVGEPLYGLARAGGYNVVGVEISDARRLSVERQHGLSQGAIRPDICTADLFIVCVPTPVNERHEPDLSPLESAVRGIAGVLQDSNVVIVESTIYPGVCEDIIKPILDTANVSYHLGHCPERINPGDPVWSVRNIPRVVGSLTRDGAERIAAFYRSIVDAEITVVSGVKEAEATKILENTFRDVNIAFVNEMALSFQKLGIDVTEVIRAATTKPFGFLPHFPGVGVGGHCIAVDPYYMIERGRAVGFDHEFLRLARKINSRMPEETLRLVQDGLNLLSKPLNGAVVGVLGLAYKPDVSDDRESPSYDLVRLLREKGADVRTFDHLVSDKSSVQRFEDAIDADCVVLATAHSEFLRRQSELAAVPLVVDGRNALDHSLFKTALYLGVGRPIRHQDLTSK